MHLSLWLLCVGTLSTGVSAFYPVKLPGEDGPSFTDSNRRRFFPVSLPSFQNEPPPLKLDLVKVYNMFKRDNQYNALMGEDPTMKNSVAINEDGRDWSYFSVVKFGSKGQPMWMLLDTGASESWVMGSSCTSPACLKHNTFGTEDSDTLVVTKRDWRVTYGTGQVEGVVVKDKLSMAGFDVEFEFGSATNASDDFLRYPMDGILGLGPSKAAKITPFLQVVSERKIFKKNIVGISLQRASDGTKDGQLTYGDVDSSKFSGDIVYTKLSSNTNRWEIPVEDMIVDGKQVNFKGKSAVIDTGTSFVLIPMKDAEAVHALIPGASKFNGYFYLPCDTKTSLEVMISGAKWTISPKDYVGKPNGTMCDSYIVGQQALGPDQWLLGDTFLKNVYSVYDYDEGRIGFATRKSQGSSNDKTTTVQPSTTTDGSRPDQTVSPMPPKNMGGTPTQGSTQPSGTSSPAQKGSAAILSAPSWLWISVLHSTGYILFYTTLPIF